MGEKSDPRGGIRSKPIAESGIRNVGSAGLMTVILKHFVDTGALDVNSAFLLLGFLTAAGSFALRVWSEMGMTARIRRVLDRVLPAAMVILAVGLSGCAVQLGRSTPHEFTSISGETLVACEIVGISVAFGDADICRNAEGGHVSKTFADMTLGVIRVVGSAVAGFFSGLGGAGQGMQAALQDDQPQAVAPAPEPASTELRNPFLGDIQ